MWIEQSAVPIQKQENSLSKWTEKNAQSHRACPKNKQFQTQAEMGISADDSVFCYVFTKKIKEDSPQFLIIQSKKQ